MPWPSKNPDDYVGRPMFSPAIPTEKVASLDELDPGDWRKGWVPPSERLAWLPACLLTAYAAAMLGGVDITFDGGWSPAIVLSAIVTDFLGRRSRAARRGTSTAASMLRSAPPGGMPIVLTVLVTFGISLAGSAAVGLATAHERTQCLGVLAVRARAPFLAWWLERLPGRRGRSSIARPGPGCVPPGGRRASTIGDRRAAVHTRTLRTGPDRAGDWSNQYRPVGSASDPKVVRLSSSPSPAAELERIVAGGLITSLYQPIVRLSSGLVAGYEALARGPKGSPLEFPDRLFGTAAEAGMTDELDATCRAAALAGAATSAIAREATLFVNTEPESSGAAMNQTYASLLANGGGNRVVFEFTERALTLRPADVLEAAARLRRLGVGIALDDVGVDARSLALLPFVQPDVVKLDLSIVQGARSRRAARVMHAVGAYAERTGAAIVAEGIETDEHLAVARSLGATHGQGWFFGRPEPAPAAIGPSEPLGPWISSRERHTSRTPFELVVAAGRPVQIASKGLLLALSQQLEIQATSLGEEAVVLGNLQDAHRFTPRTASRYTQLAATTAFAGIIGHGIDASPAPGVRGGSYDSDDPLRREWSVVVISPHFSAAMLAHDLGDDTADMERRFDYCMTYERELVADAARTLMASIANA